jgi:hypothetical protein
LFSNFIFIFFIFYLFIWDEKENVPVMYPIVKSSNRFLCSLLSSFSFIT